MQMHSLVGFGDNYSKTSGNLWQCYRDEPNDKITESFKSTIKITENTTDNSNTKNIEKAVPLKYLSNFLRTLEMPLVNCEISLLVNLYYSISSENYVFFSATG